MVASQRDQEKVPEGKILFSERHLKGHPHLQKMPEIPLDCEEKKRH